MDNVKDLIQNAHEEGSLSDDSMDLLKNIDLGAQIQAAMGIPAMEAPTSEVILITCLLDDSGSICAAGNEQVVREGYNMILDALMATKQKESIYVHTRYINGKILHPYMPLTQAPRLDSSNYQANGGTPLYDETAVMLATVVAKTQEYSTQGISVRAISVIVTDGHDQHSVKFVSTDIKPLVDDMLMSESHIIAAMGIDDRLTNFVRVFGEMGLKKEWILTPKNSAHDIRAAFRTVSQSAVRTSQAANFNSAAMGGFGTNP
ncbi:MAG: hypothetical protein PHX34_02495 [Candidatus Shapirobacteria bacterium]|nr:hypothetical protein [Candidatus Shapirobacteria bacterium]